MKTYFIGLIFLLLMVSCGKDQAEKDEEIILNYLKDNNIKAWRHSSGIYYLMTKTNDTAEMIYPSYSSRIYIKYKGYLTDGTIFDQTREGDTAEFVLNQLIYGWQYGIPLMKKGESQLLLVPSELGYGDYQNNIIPANSVLIFEIDLLDFK